MTTKGFCAWTGIVVALLTIQTSLLPRLSFHGVSTDFLLLLTVSFGFLKGARYGVLLGFCAGLLQDLVTGTFLGMNTFSKMLVGFSCGKMSDQVFKEQFFLPVFASLAAAAVQYFLLAVLMLLLGYRFHLAAHMQYTLLPMMCYQLIFAYPVHRLAYLTDQRLKEKT